MKGIRYKDKHVNYSFEAAVGIAYKALGKEWDKIDYIREYYQSYCFENVGSGYTSAMVPLFVSKNTGECYGMKAQKERWEKGDVPDDAMSIMNSDLPLPRVHFGGKYFGFSETEEFECYLNSSRNRTMQQQVAFIAPNFPV